MQLNILGKKGFTLLEMMLVIAILAIIAFLSRDFYGNFAADDALDNNAKTIIFDLRNARNRAMNGQADSNWGIHFINSGDDYYQIFSTPTNYADPAKIIESTSYLQGGIKFNSPVEGNNTDIIFNKITGTTTAASIILFTGQNQKTISINSQGLIN